MLTILRLNADIEVSELPATFHGDPADRMIFAIACAYDSPIATHDEAVKKSRLRKIGRPRHRSFGGTVPMEDRDLVVSPSR